MAITRPMRWYDVDRIRLQGAPRGIGFFEIENDEGIVTNIKIQKGRKWFTIPAEEYTEIELVKLAKNFNKEWEARVGQELED